MAVTAQTPRNISTATAGATVFPYDFKILAATDLLVEADGIALVVNVDFTVDGIGEDTGGDVTLTSALAGGETVLRQRAMPYQRLTDFQTLGDLRSGTLNNDQDAPIMMIQQLAALALLGVITGDGEFVWDAQNHRIINVADAIVPGDAVNYGQLVQQLGEFEASGLNTDPLYWEIAGDAATTDFFIPGATISAPEFYDVYLDGVAIEPYDGFTITIAPDSDGSKITFATAPADGAAGWVILRGYAKPLNDDLLTVLINSDEFIALLTQLITNTLYETDTVLQLGPTAYLLPQWTIAGTSELVDGTRKGFIGDTSNASDTTITVRANTGLASLDWDANPVAVPFFSIRQLGAGQVTITGETGVTVTPPPGYLAKTRAQESVVTVTAKSVATGQWGLSGDLAIDETYVPGGALSAFNKVLAAANSSVATAAATVPDWTFNVAAGKAYRIRVLGTYQTAATTTGGKLSILGAGGVTGSMAGRAAGALSASAVATALAVPIYAVTGTGSSLTTTGVSAADTPHWIELDAVFLCTANGSLSIQWATEVAASAAQLNAGTGLFVEEMSLTP